MTEDDFLKMVDQELDTIIQEYESLTKRLLYYQSVDRGSKQIGMINFQLAILRKKQQTLKSFLGFPAYARIKAMSDEELEQYKKTQRNYMTSDLKEIMELCNQTREKISALSQEQYSDSLSFSGLDAEKRAESIQRGRQIMSDLAYEERELQQLLGTLNEKKAQLEAVNRKQSSQFRNDMLAKTERKKSIEESVGKVVNNPISDTEKMLASVAQDPHKCQQMAYLLTLYGRLLSAEKNIKSSLTLPEALPKDLRDKIINSPDYNLNSECAYNVSGIKDIVRAFVKKFSQAKKDFDYQFTNDKLLGLGGKQKDQFYDEIDIHFLTQHRDKLELGKIERINTLIDRYNRLTYRFIKTKNLQSRIQNLNTQIQLEVNEVYHQIIYWYSLHVPKELGLQGKLDFFSEETICDFVENSQLDIELAEKALDELERQLTSVENDLQSQVNGFENQKLEVEARIRNLAGPEYSQTPMPQVRDELSYNENLILDAVGRVYADGIVRDVTARAGKLAMQTKESLRQNEEQSGLSESNSLKRRL